MPVFYFWVVLAFLYLALAVGTWLISRPIEKAFALLKEPGDTLVSLDKSGKEVGLESTLHKAYKTIIITDIVGFVLAAIAAVISYLVGSI
jgi:hypothetical protein